MDRNKMGKLKTDQPKKGVLKILVRLWRYFYAYKWMLFLALFLSVIGNILALFGPMLSGKAIDAIGVAKGGVNFNEVFRYCAIMVAFYLISSLLSYSLAVLMIHFSQKVVYQMRRDVFNKLMDLPVKFFDNNQTGDIISRIGYDIDTINTSLSTDIVQVFTTIITVAGALGMMIAISPVMTLTFTVTIPVTVLFTRYRATKLRPLFRKRSAALGALNGFVEEIVTGQKTIKAYCQEKTMISRFDEKNTAAIDAYYNADYLGSIFGPSVSFINNLTLSIISVLGAILYLMGSLTLGNLSSFVLYSRKFSGPINEMANIISEVQSAAAAAERVFSLLDEAVEPEDVPNAHIFDHVAGNVALDHVKFGYSPDKTIIHNLSMSANQGNVVAIVGPTGAGKTTIINLLMRFYDPDSGEIRLDNINIKVATRKSLRLAYAMVLQDTWLFHGTVFDNIAYGNTAATLEDVTAAAKAAKIHSFIAGLPQGYDTILNEEGLNISQGQKQLLTIARAMLLDAKILILDEATSNVDTQTELQIQGAMLKLMKNKTCFVIAHRLSTIRNADTILVVRNGDIIEQGAHNKLMEKNGFYAGLYKAQFEHGGKTQ